jgi:hypothetical protein
MTHSLPPLWAGWVWPDKRCLQRCRSRGLVLVTSDGAEVVPVATSMFVGTQTVHPIMAIALRSLSLISGGRWTFVEFPARFPVPSSTVAGSAAEEYLFAREFYLRRHSYISCIKIIITPLPP